MNKQKQNKEIPMKKITPFAGFSDTFQKFSPYLSIHSFLVAPPQSRLSNGFDFFERFHFLVRLRKKPTSVEHERKGKHKCHFNRTHNVGCHYVRLRPTHDYELQVERPRANRLGPTAECVPLLPGLFC
jgi:hypothetical protein